MKRELKRKAAELKRVRASSRSHPNVFHKPAHRREVFDENYSFKNQNSEKNVWGRSPHYNRVRRSVSVPALKVTIQDLLAISIDADGPGMGSSVILIK